MAIFPVPPIKRDVLLFCLNGGRHTDPIQENNRMLSNNTSVDHFMRERKKKGFRMAERGKGRRKNRWKRPLLREQNQCFEIRIFTVNVSVRSRVCDRIRKNLFSAGAPLRVRSVLYTVAVRSLLRAFKTRLRDDDVEVGPPPQPPPAVSLFRRPVGETPAVSFRGPRTCYPKRRCIYCFSAHLAGRRPPPVSVPSRRTPVGIFRAGRPPSAPRATPERFKNRSVTTPPGPRISLVV